MLPAIVIRHCPFWRNTHGMMSCMPQLSRRAALSLGASAAFGISALDMFFLPRTAPATPATATERALAPAGPLDPPPAVQAAPTMVTGSFVSAARGGVLTRWAIARPPGQTRPLRPVIALHGKGGDASSVMAGGMEQGLAQAVNAGTPALTVVSVDGGGSYWHRRASGEDCGAMVLNELIPLLETQNLDTSRIAFLGWSMGGYGALLLGGRLGPARTGAICAVSPALWLSPGAAAPGAFDGSDDWSANSVFGVAALESIPIRVDCGDSDPFHDAAQRFMAQLPNSPAGGFRPGGHDGQFWSAQLPAELNWLGPLLTA